MNLVSKKDQISKGNVCFSIFWGFLQFGKGMGYVASTPAFLTLLCCGIPFALGKILLTRWKQREMITLLVLNAIGIAAMISSGETTFWLTFFCISAAKDVDFKKLLKINLVVRGTMFVARTTMAIVGLLDMQVRYRFQSGMIIETRYGMGYDHPNTAQIELLGLILVLFFIYGKRLKWPHYLLVLAYNHFIFTYTDSRTAYILAIVYVIGVAIINCTKIGIVQFAFRIWSDSSWALCILLSIVGCILYETDPGFRTLGTFSSRFLSATEMISTEPLTLFGGKVNTDLGYIQIIYSGGLVVAAVYAVGIARMTAKLRKRNEKVLLWALSCFAVFTILEHSVFSVLTNGLLMYLRDAFYPQSNAQEPQDNTNQLGNEDKRLWIRN